MYVYIYIYVYIYNTVDSFAAHVDRHVVNGGSRNVGARPIKPQNRVAFVLLAKILSPKPKRFVLHVSIPSRL